ncbi:hypothetical protein GCM10027160_36770 [Streptomyces calidiresistens]|uniref:DNA-binding protein n=1 Tax=Streptomyces calidiresistens TaxID=1485586 RepID=A0A7W3XZP2_9ACTN|nr:zinc ribbon domain-containing protein [Streptomyces calidiresistens]MBB0233152.1 hypothetical protein [Streptomyces calidiresistens]
MARGTFRVFVGNKRLTCTFCDHQIFDRRDVKLNGTGMSILGLDWANKVACGLICAQCGYMQMFVDPQIRYEEV